MVVFVQQERPVLEHKLDVGFFFDEALGLVLVARQDFKTFFVESLLDFGFSDLAVELLPPLIQHKNYNLCQLRTIIQS